jgi:enoyl-CoA hydratase
MPAFGAIPRLIRISGRSATLSLALLGEHIGAQRAFEMGLVDEVVEPASLIPRALAMASMLAEQNPDAIKGILETVIRGGDETPGGAMDLEEKHFATCCGTEAFIERTRKFLSRQGHP